MELASTLAKIATKPNRFKIITITDRKEGEQLDERRNVGGSSCNRGDGTDQRVQILDVYDDNEQTATCATYSIN
jgi:hypothetical protein